MRIQQPRVTRQVGELITFAIRIPLEIDMVVDLRIDKPRFMVFGEISLRATAKAAEPLLLILDVEKPRASDIAIHVTSKSLRAEVVRIVGGVDAEIKRFIAAHVAGEIDSPELPEGQDHRRRRTPRRGLDRYLTAGSSDLHQSSAGRLGSRPSPAGLTA